MLCRPKRVIIVATNAELRNPHYYRRTWLVARNIKLPRRRWLDEIADSLVTEELHIQYPSGEPYSLPDIDDIFGDDPDMRWLSYYLNADASGQYPHSKSRKIDRLRVIDLFLKIRYPDLSKHLAR